MPQALSFREELTEVQSQLRREIRFKAADFRELVEYSPDVLEADACPAIVIAVSRACGFSAPSVVKLATIIELIFLADQVHALMKDDESLSEEGRQFPVLVGDYLYGRFFLDLCRDGLLPFLKPLAEAIITMSEGGISRWLARERELSPREWLRVLEQERASLTGLAGRLSARLAGTAETVQETAACLGQALGLAWAARQQGLGESLVQTQLAKARRIIRQFPETLEFKALYELVDFMGGELLMDGGMLRHA
ncbi:octaprenyl-diphosphate synthase [Peptococcaceae bacterium CEB3]|nr:octaprenyl-diphosphate synthase [Peptococcaceae bacterium CEB3]